MLNLYSEKPADDTDAANPFNRAAVMRRLLCLLLTVLMLGGCVAHVALPGRSVDRPVETARTFVMPDGTALPYRVWLPNGPPQAVVLALHGMNDSRDAWEYPAPTLAAAGIAVFSPDLRGFGATPTRGLWPGANGLAGDARVMARLLRARYPHTKLILMAESMGAAALMVLATEPNPPPVDGYVLVAPAVWGRSKMSFLMRASLWLADHLVPGMTLTGRGFVKVTASDNREALYRLSNDPLTIHATRVDAIEGLVDLMDRAMAAAPYFHAPALFLYGGHDELVPPRATAATWRALPKGPVLAFYPHGYHLLLRDKDRSVPLEDILSWIDDPQAPLPSGADKAAQAWLAHQKQEGVGPTENPAATP
ncbi:MAG TPA: alpha/beta fold hydrolase [Rhodopila sp.]|nr:alpha/beta fold hydrolase [Rhodopila sp.]